MKIDRQFKRDEIKDEFRVWTQLIKPELNLPANVDNVCEYGFTEILNNVIDHSEGDSVAIRGSQDDSTTVFEIEDNGVGIFSKLRSFFHFDSEIHALMELVKGKLTVAPLVHSGEGLFFSSKMFDRFTIESGSLSVTFQADECLVKNIPSRHGTLIRMVIANDSQVSSKAVFDQFCDTEEFRFYKTRFFISLAALEGGLISRSQAKRVAARLDSFSEVELNFHGVDQLGQAFADELFRVWPLNHQQTRFKIINAGNNVLQMISHIRSRKDLPQPDNALVETKENGCGGVCSRCKTNPCSCGGGSKPNRP